MENFQKHLGLFLDSKLTFFDHINENIKNATKGINQSHRENELVITTVFPFDCI